MWLIVLAASIVGSAYDPIFWICLGVAVLVAFSGGNWWLFLLGAAAVAASLRMFIASQNRIALGIPVDHTTWLSGLAVFVPMLVLGGCIGIIRQWRARNVTSRDRL